MTIYTADLGFDVLQFRANFAEAADTIEYEAEGEWHGTQYNVAAARHCPVQALRLIVESLGRDYYGHDEGDLDAVLDGVEPEPEEE